MQAPRACQAYLFNSLDRLIRHTRVGGSKPDAELGARSTGAPS
jgi:hypothetical protein